MLGSSTGGKNDANDAEAICEAVGRPNMRFVPVKSEEAQAVLSVHRARTLTVAERTALINQVRGLLGEFGIVTGAGTAQARKLLAEIGVGGRQLPLLARETIGELHDRLRALDERILAYDRKIAALAKQSEPAQRLMAIEGIGPITATALVASVGNAQAFKSGRQFAAWLGLTPRQNSSGGKTKLGAISKRGDVVLRPEIALALAPISWLAALVCDSEHCHGIALNLIKDRIGEVTENMSPDRILVFGPHQRIEAKPINCLKCLGSKSAGRNRAALEVPKESLSYFCLNLGQNLDSKAGHRALSLALASAHETALTVPARSAACRALISCRQASVIEESSLPSRLSSSATAKAERSSAGKPRASSRMWSTWAFMRQSLALKPTLVTACSESTPNLSFHRTYAKIRAGR